LEVEGATHPDEKATELVTIEHAFARFVADLEARQLRPSTIRKYRLLKTQLTAFLTSRSVRLVRQIQPELMEDFRASWKDGAMSSSKKLERLRAFFRYAQKRKWIAENPAAELKPPRIVLKPTMPFTHDEMSKILSAVSLYLDTAASNGLDNARRIRGLVLVLRYTGMRISDAVSLRPDRVNGGRLFLYTQKTGVAVYTVLPEFVVNTLESTPRASEGHYFWSGRGTIDSAVRSWQTRLRKLFKLAGLPGHAHRFRDTLAVELLLAGVPIERVSVLLGHQSVKVTERHYNPWVHARQQQLEADLERVWAHDPIVLRESAVTRRLRGENELLN
jgi:integrase